MHLLSLRRIFLAALAFAAFNSNAEIGIDLRNEIIKISKMKRKPELIFSNYLQ